jgi:hypothetical protein
MMPKQEGRNMIMVISPNKRYQERLAKDAAKQAADDGTDAGELPVEAATENEERPAGDEEQP